MGAIYVTRLARLPLLAADESPVGRIADVVLGAPYRDAPRGSLVLLRRFNAAAFS